MLIIKCEYCGSRINEQDQRCPHCGGDTTETIKKAIKEEQERILKERKNDSNQINKSKVKSNPSLTIW